MREPYSRGEVIGKLWRALSQKEGAMRRNRFSGVIAVLGVCLLVGALATQAMAQDGPETQATATQASRLQAKLQAKVMTDEQMDQVTAGNFNGCSGALYWCGVDLVKLGAFTIPFNPSMGLMEIKWGTIKIIQSIYPSSFMMVW